MVNTLLRVALACCLGMASLGVAVAAPAVTTKVGVVLMHGKGGSPAALVGDLAKALEAKGYLVANIEMPWSAQRSYDVSPVDAEKEVSAALDGLRAQGATKLFVAGHSQGGLYALYYGGKHALDGIVAIAPGGNTNSPVVKEGIGGSLEQARKLIAAGKAGDKASLLDFESAKGAYAVNVTPANYLAWFDPEGAMNQMKAMQTMNPATPVLYLAPLRDYPGLIKVKQMMYDALPANPLHRLHEVNSDHIGAPAAATDAIVRWSTAVISTAKAAAAAPATSTAPPAAAPPPAEAAAASAGKASAR